MNRDRVGMIYCFLPKEEQEEIKSLLPDNAEWYSVESDKWYVERGTTISPWEAYRPKGLKSWKELYEEMRHSFNKMYKGKKIRSIHWEHGLYPKGLLFNGHWNKKDDETIELEDGEKMVTARIDVSLHFWDYGFEIINDI